MTDLIDRVIRDALPKGWVVFQVFNNDDFNAAFQEDKAKVRPPEGFTVHLRHLETGMMATGGALTIGKANKVARDRIFDVVEDAQEWVEPTEEVTND